MKPNDVVISGKLMMGYMEGMEQEQASPSFKAGEFKCHDGFGYWWISVQLLNVLENIRKITGPLIVVSGYRTPSYNKKVGGAPRSLHMAGFAADIRPIEFGQFYIPGFAAGHGVPTFSAFVETVYKNAPGGVGIYEKKGFIHVDIGPARTWQG